MTDNTETTATEPTEAQDAQETPQEPQGAPEGTEPTDDPQDDDQDDQGQEHPAREAAKYRRRLRDTEAERDQLRGQLETMRKAEAERIAAATVKNPAGIWAAGATVADMLDQDGNVDPEKVKAATVEAAEALGLARAHRGNYSPLAGRVPSNPGRGGDLAAVIRG